MLLHRCYLLTIFTGDMGILAMMGILTGRIIKCIIAVHSELGPGYAEKLYRRAFVIELRKENLRFEIEKSVPIYYAGHLIGRHSIDILIENKVVVELKTVEMLTKKDYAQTRSYLKATGLTTALLVNFSTERADYRHISAIPSIPKKEREAPTNEDQNETQTDSTSTPCPPD